MIPAVYGVHYYYTKYPDGFVDPWVLGRVYHAGSFNSAMFYTWIGNGYQWQFFLVPLCVSLGCIGVCIFVNLMIEIFKLRQVVLPGFRAKATHRQDETVSDGYVEADFTKGSDVSNGDKSTEKSSPTASSQQLQSNEISTPPLVQQDRWWKRYLWVMVTMGGCLAGTMLLFLLFLVDMDPITNQQ